MSISYRLRKNEFVLMLDLFGNPESLEQKFGNLYIDCREYDEISSGLHRKGFVTLSGDTISAESGMEVMMKAVYNAPLAFAEKNAGSWVYCTGEFMLYVRAGGISETEYFLTAAADDEDRTELAGKLSGRKFRFIRGGHGEISGEELVSTAGGYPYEK